MAAQDNYWDDPAGLWRDRATGNYMKPTDKGGDGIWYSPDGRQKFVNGVWVDTAGAGAQGAATGTGTGYGLAPDYMWTVDQLNRDFTAQQNQAQQNFTAQQTDLARSQTAHLTEVDANLQRELQRGTIDANQYMQERELAQRESEFARNIALQTLTADRDNELRRIGEARQERLLQAQLAANPQDLVAYEFYKRNLGQPEAWDLAQQFAAGGEAGANAPMTTVENPSVTRAKPPTETLSGQPYPEQPPAYSDEALQELASSFYDNTPGNTPLYDPKLSGTGVFGAQIKSPGAISRSQGMRLSDSEMGVLSSFLRGGIDMGGGKRVSINPDEYFQQVEKSWIPTLSGVGTQTQYR